MFGWGEVDGEDRVDASVYQRALQQQKILRRCFQRKKTCRVHEDGKRKKKPEGGNGGKDSCEKK